MSEIKATDAHAFPTHWQDDVSGMQLRDYFAAKAMSGWLASYGENAAVKIDHVAEFAYKVADAMLVARGGDHE